MEAMLGETGEGSREVGNSFDSVGVRFNGELNGDFDAVDVDNSVRSNAITLKMVPNNCLQGDCSNISNSVSQVANDVGENAEHLTTICSDQLERCDKVPNSEPTFRDLVSEVPTSIGESVDSVGVEDEEEETSNINSDMDRELPQESNKNCGSDSVTGSSVNDDDISYKMISGEEGELEQSDTCHSPSENEKSKTVECDVDIGDECNNRASSNSEKEISVDGLNSPRSNESENQYNVGSECNNSGSGDGTDENNLNLEVDDDPLNQTGDEEKKADSDNSVEDVSNAVDTDGLNESKTDDCEVSSSNPEPKDEHEDQNQNQGEDTETKTEENSSKTKKSRKSAVVLNLTPRRSSRNLNKQKSYVEKEEDPDIQEITPSDPLADPLSTDSLRDDKENSKTRNARKNTIVVNDTKRLVEIATGSKGMKGGKKEPTLVIIDTNSILSGRGPVPVPQSSPPGPSSVAGSTSGYSVLPVAVPTQGLYPPIRLNTPFPTNSLQHPAAMVPARPAPPPPPPQPPQILPTLTDDMYVVEAPSFIVPYVYEKPPIKPLKEYLEQLEIEIEETKSSNTVADEEKASDLIQENECGSVEHPKKQSDEEQCAVNGEDAEKDAEKELGDTKVENNEKNVEVNDDESEGDGASKQKNSSETKDENREDTSPQDCEKSGEPRNSENTLNSSDVGIKNEMKLEETGKSSYFENPLGKFFMQIGINLVQEYVQTDLLRSQKRKREREGKKGMVATQFAINSLVKNLEFSKENNEPFHLEQKKCEYCSFKTESSLVMAQHLETPHMRNYVYRCNFCPLEFRNPHDILFHMEAEHNVRGRLERAPAFHQCPNCPFEDSQKGKLTRHMLSCAKKHKPERNQEPPPDWEPPAKIPRLARSRPTALGLGAAAYQAMAAKSVHPLLPKLVPGTVLPPAANINRGRGRPPIHGRYIPPDPKATRPIAPTQVRQNMIYRPGAATGQPQVLLPTAYQIAGSQIYQSTSKNPTAKLLQQPSISITPLPRQPAGMAPGTSLHPKHMGHSGHPGHSPNKATFVICEICDGYIKDLEQLRNHMQWIHKVKIHPKMIYNRPPLNCQKCQFRFFTDQGLERHLLGSHGLVTSSMQEAANKGKDGGRCPVCGRVYQWKLLNHVARDHNMSLKPAHLSYKCTVCTATFGMYKQFENHVYSAHSVVAKRVIDKKSPQVPRPQASETLLKPLKINDEITIIPQPARPRPGPASRTGAVSAIMQQNMGPKRFKQRLQQKQSSVQVIELEDSPVKKDKASGGSGFQENGEDTLNAVKERLRRRKSLEISQVDSECTSQLSDDAPSKKRRRNDE